MTQQDPRIPFNHQTTTATSSSTTTTTYYPVPNDPTHETYEEIYYPPPTASCMNPQPFVRVVKRRTTANKKERRRTQSINSAFAYLRDCIPNVPSDTKLSKVNRTFDRFFLSKKNNVLFWFIDKNIAIGHFIYKLLKWCFRRRSRSIEWFSCRIGAIIEENKC